MSSVAMTTAGSRRISPLGAMLIFVMALFIGILIWVYFVSKRAHPVFLDEHGRPVNAQESNGHAEHH